MMMMMMMNFCFLQLGSVEIGSTISDYNVINLQALFWCAVWLDHCSSTTLTLTLRIRYYGYSHYWILWIVMDL